MGKQSTGQKILHSKIFSLIVLTVILCIVIYILKPNFIAKGNIRGVLNNMCVQGTIMAGLACLIIGGGIDLSSGSQAALASLIFAQILASNSGFPWPLALLIAMCFGVVAGLINSFFTNVLNFMPFISTIGMSSVYSGIATVWTRGNTVPVSVQSFTDLGKVAFIERIPLLFVVMLVIIIVYNLMLSQTRFGRSIYMVGGNPYAARLSGLNPAKIRTVLFINNSVIASFAGVMWVAQKKLASPTNITTSMPDMNAITASILGGVAFMGGSGALGGAFVGMILLNVFDNALTILKVPNFWNIAAQGLLLIVALIIDSLNTSRARRALMASTTKGEGGKVTA
jgi:ribose/xylose/arabinose/galactoside ABC-type transport system permease subunit